MPLFSKRNAISLECGYLTMDIDKKSEEEMPKAEEPEAQDENDQLGARLEEALREKDQFHSLAQRTQADFVNFKRRVEEEKIELQRFANSGLILKILSVVDDYERVLLHMPDEGVDHQWLEGIKLVKRNLDLLLVSEGVKRIQADHGDFDPNLHEAVLFQESDEFEEGKVLQIVREGFSLYDRVIRPAQVAVSRAKPSKDETTGLDENTTNSKEEA